VIANSSRSRSIYGRISVLRSSSSRGQRLVLTRRVADSASIARPIATRCFSPPDNWLGAARASRPMAEQFDTSRPPRPLPFGANQWPYRQILPHRQMRNGGFLKPRHRNVASARGRHDYSGRRIESTPRQRRDMASGRADSPAIALTRRRSSRSAERPNSVGQPRRLLSTAGSSRKSPGGARPRLSVISEA